ncbi:MAG TPA: sigma 54-interacting transcriptional regulator [Pirellulales bacterium]|jgi:PAS domain S-box-containing protein
MSNDLRASAEDSKPGVSAALQDLAVDPSDVAVLRAIVEGTVQSTGEAFFQSLVRNLAVALNVKYAFVAEFAAVNTRVRTLAYWFDGRICANVEYDLDGTPCEEVVRGGLCHHQIGVKDQFPRDLPLKELGIESYLGVPLLDSDGAVLGHLAVFDPRPMDNEPRRFSIFQIFAARAAAELARLRIEQMLRDNEERFRDLFEEAPIAYVNEDLESRFISANRAAMRILGIQPDEVAGAVGRSFIPDTPHALRRFQEAFASVGKGTDTSGVVLELRRRDNGQPIWIQWWSKPDPSGTYTRTMFVDITERVLMEQEKARLTAENDYLQEEIKSVHNFDEIVGQSPSVAAVLDNVRLVAPTDASVLICGETGTGKELIARAIHSVSRRSDKPLIKVNCAALPTGLVESELFGHEKGAFTGAIARRVGRFELADGGTIFLDEIGELPPDAQSKLLRVLQEREFERVGGNTSLKVDVRIIAATNRDLLKSVREKTFREDLYYRLNVFPLVLPPLRERKDDIPLLVHFLVGKFSTRIGRKIETVSRQAIERLQSYDWPGNIRELENIIERAVIVAPGSMLDITADMLAPPTSGPVADGQLLSLEDFERQHILSVLKRSDWVIDGPRGAALILNLHPNTLRSRMKKMGISRGD